MKIDSFFIKWFKGQSLHSGKFGGDKGIIKESQILNWDLKICGRGGRMPKCIEGLCAGHVSRPGSLIELRQASHHR